MGKYRGSERGRACWERGRDRKRGIEGEHAGREGGIERGIEGEHAGRDGGIERGIEGEHAGKEGRVYVWRVGGRRESVWEGGVENYSYQRP